jgi:N-acetylneuraminic acid mutarotase
MNTPSTFPRITWRRGPDIPLPRGGYYAAWHAGGLLLAGGTHWQDGKKLWTDEVNFFHPGREEWECRGPLPRRLGYGCMAEVAGRLYLFGGSDEAQVYRDVYVLDHGRWEPAGETPVSIQYITAPVVGRRAYFIGGTPLISDLTKATQDVWAFDGETAGWQALEPFPGPPRVLQASAAIGQTIYLFGGCTQRAGAPLQNLSDAWRFDTVAGRWTPLAPAPAARAWSAAAAGEKVYLFGGYGAGFLDSVICYDPAADSYALVGTLPLPLGDCKFFYGAGAFYAAAGEHVAAGRFAGTLIGRFA